MHLIPSQKQTQRGIAAHPPRVLSVAHYSACIGGAALAAHFLDGLARLKSHLRELNEVKITLLNSYNGCCYKQRYRTVEQHRLLPKTDSTWDCCSSIQSFVCGYRKVLFDIAGLRLG